MNEDKVQQPWFQRNPQLFKEQEAILKSAGFTLNEEIFKQHQVQFTGRSKADPDRQLLVEFPESFPSAAPKIRDTPASKLFPRHHRADTRQFCLFGFNENRWNATLSVAAALDEVEKLISDLKGGKLVLPDEPPEPISRSLSFSPESAILIPPPISAFDSFAEVKYSTGKFSGKFSNEIGDKKGTRGRGIVFEANFGDKKITCGRPYAGFFANQGKEFHGDWFFIKEPLTHENFRDVLNKCLQQAKSFKKADIYWLGLVFREETARADRSLITWLIARAHAKAPEIHLLRAFTALLRCGECGYSVTAEVQKGHTYYRCTRKSRAHKCGQPYVREEVLDAEISALLKPFTLRADWADEMLLRVKNEKKDTAQSAAQLAAQKGTEIEKINQRLKKLLDSFLDGIIERNEYADEKARLMSQKKTLEGQRDACRAGRADWLEPCPRLQKSPWFLRKSVVTTRRKLVCKPILILSPFL